MLNSIDFLNDSNILTENCVIVSFDIVNMFPVTENESSLHAVKNALKPEKNSFHLLFV